MALTDRKVKTARKPAEGHYDLWDTEVKGFGCRISYDGRRTWVLMCRYPGSKNPTRRALGHYPSMSLADAREKASHWRKLIGQRKDPAVEEERLRAQELIRQASTFAAVAEAFIADKLPGERKAKEVERDIRRVFMPAWGKRPIADITALDIRKVIRTKAKTAKAQARNLLGHAKRLFDWAVDEGVYGLEASPAAALKPSKIIGDKAHRSRILNDDELFALYRAAKRMGYPHGTVYLMLLYTALRLNEAADAKWSEFPPRSDLWVIQAERMKGKNSKAKPHAVPLTKDIGAILESLPRFSAGEFLFSTTGGIKPVWMSDKVKKRIDRRMLRTLRALARHHGHDPARVRLEPWENHDIRRTVRSHLSRLKVTEEAREAVLAHVRPGIKGVYDLHDYLPEKREALTLWADRLRSIVGSGAVCTG